MPLSWKKYKLKELCSKIGSGATPRGGQESYISEGISLIRSQNILDFSFSKNGLAFITERQANELSNVAVENNDVLLNITGDSVARVSQVPSNILPARVNQHVAILRTRKEILEPKYLKYYLLSPSQKQKLLSMASSGATRQALTKGMIEELEVLIPPVSEQFRITSILSSLDDKIELNQQMNQTLEAIAQAIFKEWFVKFNFPSFDGKLVGGLPKGWKEAGLGEFIYVQNGYAFKSSDFKNDGEIGVIKIKNISNSIVDIDDVQYIDEEVVRNIDLRFKISSNDLLIAMTGAQVGKVGLVPTTEKSLWLNQRVGLFKEKVKFSKWFVYLILSTPEYQSTLLSSAVGSAQPNISSKQIENIKTIIPPSDLIEKFGEIINTMFISICENNFENQILTQLRDSLLPKLMSGKIKVNE